MTIPQVEASAGADAVINMLFEAAAPALCFGKDYRTTDGLTFGWLGGRWNSFAIDDDSETLGASATHYMVVAVATGVVSFATSTTNWNNTTDYWRAYKLTASASALTIEDHRGKSAGGGGGGGGTVTNTGGSLTANRVILGAGTDDTKVVAGISTDGTSVLNLGAAGASVGKVALANATSGSVTIQPPTGALGSSVLTAPAKTATLATTAQADEMISGYIGTAANKTYKLVVKAAHGGTITEVTTISESGTCTATWKINTTALGGTANSVSTSEQSQAQASANVFSAGDDLQLTVSSNATCVGMSFTIKYTRTLA